MANTAFWDPDVCDFHENFERNSERLEDSKFPGNLEDSEFWKRWDKDRVWFPALLIIVIISSIVGSILNEKGIVKKNLQMFQEFVKK